MWVTVEGTLRQGGCQDGPTVSGYLHGLEGVIHTWLCLLRDTLVAAGFRHAANLHAG